MKENRNRKTELLAPAGSFEILKAVECAGADAVYAAGNKFGARAYAGNFTQEEFEEAIDYMHLRGKKLYLTVNTLLKEQELEQELYDYLRPFYEAGLDAVIVQDLGVLHFIKTHFPALPIHASTQMTITGAYGAKLMLDAGCSRIVTARELSFAEIADIYEKTGAEIESFVHGALCYCYSGQCLLSSMIGGRSGNRGRCAQPCRLPYQVLLKEQKRIFPKQGTESFPLSPKDLCTIQMIPELIQSGIHSFKIEGRMKQAEYAAGVTSIYRKYIDRYEAEPDRSFQVSLEDQKHLLDLGNRCGFTDGYYRQHNGPDMITFSRPSHEKSNDGLQQKIQERFLHRESKEKIKGILILSKEMPARLVLEYKGSSVHPSKTGGRQWRIEETGSVVQAAEKQPMSPETIAEKIKKTGNTPFVFEELKLELEPDIFIPVGALNQLRRSALEHLEEQILSEYRRPRLKEDIQVPYNSQMQSDSRQAQPNCSQAQHDSQVPSDSSQAQHDSQVPSNNSQVPHDSQVPSNSKVLPRLHVLIETEAQLTAALHQPEVRRIYLETASFGTFCKAMISRIQAAGKECFLALPYIFRQKTAERYQRDFQKQEMGEADGYLVRNLEELGFLQAYSVSPTKIQTDYNISVFSNEAQRALENLPVSSFTLPAELNRKELKALDCRDGEMMIYGRQPLMVSAQCIRKNTGECDHTKDIYWLKDRYGKLFPVKNECTECYNVIYNTSPLSLFHHRDEIKEIAPRAVRLSFSVETGQETEQVFAVCRRIFLHGTHTPEDGYWQDFTNGHFKRGVE